MKHLIAVLESSNYDQVIVPSTSSHEKNAIGSRSSTSIDQFLISRSVSDLINEKRKKKSALCIVLDLQVRTIIPMNPTTPSTNTKKLYVGNFDESMNEYALLQLFKPFGKITFIEVMIHRIGPKKGLPRGFGFLEYEKKEQALKAINTLHRKVIRGKPLVVSFAHMTPEQEEAQKRDQGLHKRPTTFSLLKGHKMKDSTTDAKIRAIERKLELLKKQSSSSSSEPSSTNTSKGQNRYKPY